MKTRYGNVVMAAVLLILLQPATAGARVWSFDHDMAHQSEVLLSKDMMSHINNTCRNLEAQHFGKQVMARLELTMASSEEKVLEKQLKSASRQSIAYTETTVDFKPAPDNATWLDAIKIRPQVTKSLITVDIPSLRTNLDAAVQALEKNDISGARQFLTQIISLSHISKSPKTQNTQRHTPEPSAQNIAARKSMLYSKACSEHKAQLLKSSCMAMRSLAHMKARHSTATSGRRDQTLNRLPKLGKWINRSVQNVQSDQ